MGASDRAARCTWAEGSEAMRRYHDEEWGDPSHDDRHLFEMLVLEGAQAGLSWSTILTKRATYRRVFAGFDPARVARFTPSRMARLMDEPGIVRNRLKVAGTITNANAFLETAEENGTFARYLWRWVDGRPVVHRPRTAADVPVTTELSHEVSRDLKRRGFTFVGPTIVYSFPQAVGVVDDHLVTCPSKRDRRKPARTAVRGALERGGRP